MQVSLFLNCILLFACSTTESSKHIKADIKVLTMSPNQHSYYQPFNKSYLGMLLDDNSSKKNNLLTLASSGVQYNSSNENEAGFIMDSISLYYQPLQDPLHVIVFFVIRTLLVIFAEFVQFKALRAIQKETGIINRIATLYLIVLMIAGPYYLIFFTTIDLIYPVHKIIGEWFCFFGSFVGYLIFNIIAFHSFIVALMRYFFIVHREAIIKYGKDRYKNVFLFLSFFIPLTIDILGELTYGGLNPISSFNRCHGVDHKMFLIKTSTLDEAKLPFCEYTPLSKEGPFGELLAMLKYTSCIVTVCIYLIMGFNVTEGIIYYKTFSHIIR